MTRHKKFSSIGKKLNPKNLYKTNRKIDKIIVHCTASVEGSMIGAKEVDDMHLARWGSKSGCGYHYIVKYDGTLEKGRWVDYAGAQAKGYNAHTIGIAYVGGLTKGGLARDDLLSREQRASLIATIKTLKELYGLGKYDIIGHRELPHVNKACPCMDMNALRNDI